MVLDGQILLWAGAGIIGFSIVLALICACFFGIKNKKLNESLEKEYGSLQRHRK